MRWKILIVSLPILIPLGALAYWMLQPPAEERLRVERRAAAAAELASLMPRVETGEPDALVRAGVILRNGSSGRRDPTQAAFWFSEAAEKGNAEAGYQLGRLYELGHGVRPDYRRAAEWYRIAAEIGKSANAQFALGELYFKGRGVVHDYRESLGWYLSAARGGHPGAQAVIGSMFEKGWLLDRDYAEAYKWYSLAAQHGNEAMNFRRELDPRKALDELQPKMSRLERMRGEQKLRAFAAMN
jgi:TPR repeat protein